MRRSIELLLLRKQKLLKHKRTQNQSRTHMWRWNRHAGTGTSTANFTAGIVRGYYSAARLPSQPQSYPGQSREPRPGTAVRPASLLHLRAHTHTHSTQYSTQISLSSGGDDRGYPPCSSSLLEPELPSSQQLLVLGPLPDRLFPPTGPPPGARPLLLPEASGFLSSIAGILAASSG